MYGSGSGRRRKYTRGLMQFIKRVGFAEENNIYHLLRKFDSATTTWHHLRAPHLPVHRRGKRQRVPQICLSHRSLQYRARMCALLANRQRGRRVPRRPT